MSKRKTGNKRQLLSNYLIVVEGETEQLYLESLKSLMDYERKKQINIKIVKANAGNAKTFVQDAIKLKKKLELPNVYVVFDNDNYKYIADAFALAEKNDIRIIYSNICFELWFLLHFKFTTSQFEKCNKLILQLKRHFPGYKKASYKTYEKFNGIMTDAMENAKKLEDFHQKHSQRIPLWELNPYTNMHHLIKEVFALDS